MCIHIGNFMHCALYVFYEANKDDYYYICLRVFNLLKRNTPFFTAEILGIPQHNYVQQNNNVTASYKLDRYTVSTFH